MTFKTFLAENLVFFFGFALLLFMAAAVMGTLWLLMQAGERFTLKNAIVLGCYMGNGTWFLEDYPEIDDAKVLCWAPTLYWEGKR